MSYLRLHTILRADSRTKDTLVANFTDLTNNIAAAFEPAITVVPVDAVEEPHITVYRGPKSGAYIPYFGERMGTAGIRRRLERLVDEYAAEHGGNGLSVRVTGLQLLQDGKVVAPASMRAGAASVRVNTAPVRVNAALVPRQSRVT
ncbi:hypothetical protein C8R44DRAFT_891738 [Mycena epipterygia]|nr:hypothetical protein C8R44DRAFT_891738 [Mycena epipterygia]